MKQTIAKKSKKWLKTLKRNGFREPFQIIIDNSFIKAANQQKIGQYSLNEMLRNEPKLYMTKCTYEKHKAHLIEKDFSGYCEIIKCGHEKPQTNCVYQFIKENNPHHYILATNNHHYISELKESKHIPVLTIFRSQLTINCNKLDCTVGLHEMYATKSELRHLKRMFG
ncbi:uncharacterized protein VICG_00560 [Vittaforma corneae ATCC 50505]|uniref:Uncharacterized protein n=1 Tax=Vittaforma corneae (strain ATCC 50505) TaxID=993615 RepID=L2GNP2_VITCO|nr:uncharacterized protein VICG_00560 [Vittaforma corneae ATCC 50505]ELA42461.1 hypothetical protein VICG_00560 [Vittaforma corneae ATCC 50505]